MSSFSLYFEQAIIQKIDDYLVVTYKNSSRQHVICHKQQIESLLSFLLGEFTSEVDTWVEEKYGV